MKRLILVGARALRGAASYPPLAAAGDNESGFHTSTPAMLTPLAAGSSVKPIISVGDMVGGYTFESIPDGISLHDERTGHGRRLREPRDLARPFPATRSDFTNAMVSKLSLNQHSAGVSRGRTYAIPSSAGYQRFCSNFLVGRSRASTASDLHERGGARHRAPAGGLVAPAWPVSADRARCRAGRRRRRLRREERRVPVDLRHGPPQPREQRRRSRATGTRSCSRATTRSTRPRRSSTCYAARERRGRLERPGHALRLRLRRPGRERLRRPDARRRRRAGHFIEVPRTIATGKKVDGTEVKSADFGYPAPPSTGSRTGRSGCSSTGANINNVVPVHPRRGHRLRPDERRTSSTSRTRASRGRCPTRDRPARAAGRPGRAGRT